LAVTLHARRAPEARSALADAGIDCYTEEVASPRHAVLLTAYKNPEQTARLARALRHPRVDVFVHVDRKFEEAPFLREGLIPVSHRILINWAGFGIVEASLRWLEQARAREEYATHVLLSAQDYPIRSIEEIVAILDAHDRERVQIEQPPGDYTWRWNIFQVRDREGLRGFRDRVLKSAWFRERRVRNLPRGLAHAVGSTYWVLSAPAVDWLLATLRERPEIVDFFRNTFASDEMFFQILFAASPFAANLAPNLHYIDWSQGGSHPKILGTEDFDRLVSCGACFARKFDTEEDSAILDRIDREILAKGAYASPVERVPGSDASRLANA